MDDREKTLEERIASLETAVLMLQKSIDERFEYLTRYFSGIYEAQARHSRVLVALSSISSGIVIGLLVQLFNILGK